MDTGSQAGPRAFTDPQTATVTHVVSLRAVRVDEVRGFLRYSQLLGHLRQNKRDEGKKLNEREKERSRIKRCGNLRSEGETELYNKLPSILLSALKRLMVL